MLMAVSSLSPDEGTVSLLRSNRLENLQRPNLPTTLLLS